MGVLDLSYLSPIAAPRRSKVGPMHLWGRSSDTRLIFISTYASLQRLPNDRWKSEFEVRSVALRHLFYNIGTGILPKLAAEGTFRGKMPNKSIRTFTVPSESWFRRNAGGVGRPVGIQSVRRQVR
eukprot:scaffold10159_cov80-Skeletonema_marinoi.AAC.5